MRWSPMLLSDTHAILHHCIYSNLLVVSGRHASDTHNKDTCHEEVR